MERLLKDAQAITGVKYDISNLADVYTAIGVIQEKLGIAGTTAKEAATTISGSAATMKAAWQNVLTAISGGGDLDRAIENLVDSVSTYFENIVPVVERALSGIVTLIEKAAPMLVQTVAKSLIKAIPSLLSAVYEMIIGLSKGVYQGIVDLFNGTSKDVLTEQAETIEQSVENQNDLTKAVEETNEATKRTLAGFDDIQILSAGTVQEVSEQPIIPEVSGGDLGESIEVEETEKEASALGVIFEQISKTIKKAWDSEPVQSFWEVVKLAGKTGLKSFKTTEKSLRKNLKTTWSNIEGDFNTMASNMSGLWSTFWKDVQVGIDTWGQPIIDGVNGVFNSIWTTAIDPYIQLMVGAWSDFTSTLKSKWEEHGQPLIDNIGQFATNVIELFRSIYDNVLEPIITPFLETLSWLWGEHFSKMVSALGDFIMSLVNGVLEIYNKFIAPLVDLFLKQLAPALSLLGNLVIGVFGTIFGTISDVATGLLEILTGLIDFIVGVFTGNWEKAWEGVKSIFKGIFDALVGIAKAPINLIIDAVNALISGLNKVQFDLPDWGILGDWAGKTLGINIPKIPKLAQGAVLPPNKPFLSIVGDQKHGTNIEAPLSTIQEAVQMVMNGQMEEMAELLASSIEVQREILEAVLGIEIGDDVIGNAVSRYQRKMTVIHGG